MKLELLSAVGKVLGVKFKVDGIPYGDLSVSPPSILQTVIRD